MSFLKYLKSTKGELKHVNWPTKNQTIVFTVIVIAISLSVGIYLGALDYIFITLLEMFIL